MLLKLDPTKIVQPPWFIGEYQFSEPWTTITDLMIAAVSWLTSPKNDQF